MILYVCIKWLVDTFITITKIISANYHSSMCKNKRLGEVPECKQQQYSYMDEGGWKGRGKNACRGWTEQLLSCTLIITLMIVIHLWVRHVREGGSSQHTAVSWKPVTGYFGPLVFFRRRITSKFVLNEPSIKSFFREPKVIHQTAFIWSLETWNMTVSWEISSYCSFRWHTFDTSFYILVNSKCWYYNIW